MLPQSLTHVKFLEYFTFVLSVTLKLLLLQHDISKTLQIAQDVLHMDQMRHETEEVPDQEWVNAMKVCFHSSLTCFCLSMAQCASDVPYCICSRHATSFVRPILLLDSSAFCCNCDSGSAGSLLFCTTRRATICLYAILQTSWAHT